MLVYQLGQTAGNTPDPCEIVDTGAGDSLQTAELAQQVPAPLRSNAGNAFQRRSHTPRVTPRPVPCDRETVRFVAQLLNQVQRG